MASYSAMLHCSNISAMQGKSSWLAKLIIQSFQGLGAWLWRRVKARD
jgi:hypothetical protein